MAENAIGQILQALQILANEVGERREQIELELQEFELSEPECPMIFAHILANEKEEAIEVRQMAGYKLKSALASKEHPVDMEKEKQCFETILTALGDDDSHIRETAGTVISQFIQNFEFENSFPFIEELIGALENESFFRDGALDCLLKIIEDNEDKCVLIQLKPELQKLIAQIIIFAGKIANIEDNAPVITTLEYVTVEDRTSRSTKLKESSLEILQLLVIGDPNLLEGEILDKYLELIKLYASKQDNEIKKEVLEIFANLLTFEQFTNTNENKLLEIMPSLSEFVIGCMNDTELTERVNGEIIDTTALDVVINATDFWQAAILNPVFRSVGIEERLEDICKPLLINLHMSSIDELAYINKFDEDTAPASMTNFGNKPWEGSKQKEEEEDDEDEEELHEEAEGEYTLRKSAANSLECLSQIYPEEICQLFKPLIIKSMQEEGNENWYEREIGIFALIILAKYCTETLASNEDEMMTMMGLLAQLTLDNELIIEEDALYGLGKFALWICGPLNEQDELKLHRAPDESVLVLTLNELTNGMKNEKKSLQRCACTALELIILEAASRIIPYLEGILKSIEVGMNTYEKSNCCLLCNIIVALCDAIGENFIVANNLHLPLIELLQNKLTTSCEPSDSALEPCIIQTLSHISYIVGREEMIKCSDWIVVHCGRLMRQEVQIKQEKEGFPEFKQPGYIEDEKLPEEDNDIFNTSVGFIISVVDGSEEEDEEGGNDIGSEIIEFLANNLEQIPSNNEKKYADRTKILEEEIKKYEQSNELGAIKDAKSIKILTSIQERYENSFRWAEESQENYSFAEILSESLTSSSVYIRYYSFELLTTLLKYAKPLFNPELEVEELEGSYIHLLQQQADEQLVNVPLLNVVSEEILRNLIPIHMIQREQDKGKVDIQNQSEYAPLYFSLGYNCVSSLSELIELIGPQIEEAVEGILESLLPQLNLISIVYTGEIPKAAQSYDQEYGINTAMSHVMAVAECISLIALIFPSPTVQTLNNQKFIEEWIVSLRSKCEKTDIIHVQSVRGICAAIKAEPAVMCQNFNQLLQLLLSIVPGRLMYGNNEVKNAVLEEVKGVLIGLRDAMVQQPAEEATGSLWGEYAGALGDSYKQVLEKIYGIPSQ